MTILQTIGHRLTFPYLLGAQKKPLTLSREGRVAKEKGAVEARKRDRAKTLGRVRARKMDGARGDKVRFNYTPVITVASFFDLEVG
ncbi:hypothetical protein BgiBS90_014463, partial [Biomphalaria glabrata]